MSTQNLELHVPDGYYPPYAAVTDTDHGAFIIIAVALGLTFVLVSSSIRLFLRISFSQRAGLDDTFLVAATVSRHVLIKSSNMDTLLTRESDSWCHSRMHYTGCMLAWPRQNHQPPH